MSINKKYKKLAILLISAVSIAVIACGKNISEQKAAYGFLLPESIASSLGSDLNSPKDPYTDGKVLAKLDGYPITSEELERFGYRFYGEAGIGHGGQTGPGPIVILPAFVRFAVSVNEAERLGLESDSGFLARFRLLIKYALAAIYVEWLKENAAVDPMIIEAVIPTEWARMNFDVLMFPDAESADSARGSISTSDEFHSFKKNIMGNSARVSETGMIFPESGFFDQWDDIELFKLMPGDVFGPVKTGIGPAIVLVKERKDFSPEEQSEYVKREIKQLAGKWASDKVKEQTEEIIIDINSEALANAVYWELGKGWFSDEVVAIVGDEKITYRMFRLFNRRDYGYIRRGMPVASWVNPVRADLKELLQNITIGSVAYELASSSEWTGRIPADIDMTIYDYRKSILYYSYLDHLRAKVGETVTKEELEAYYTERSDEFVYPPRAQISYYFVKDDGLASRLIKTLEEKGFGAAATETLQSSTGGHTMGRLKRMEVIRGDKALLAIQDEIFAMEEGQSALLKGDMGHYLLKVDRAQPEELPSLEEAKKQITDMIIRERLSVHVDKTIDQLTKKAKVELLGELKEHLKGEEIPHSDTG